MFTTHQRHDIYDVIGRTQGPPLQDSNDIHGGYWKTDPADVALVSPQTPLTPLYNPLLPGGYSKPYPWIPSYSWTFSGFFASSLAIIRLYKLSTLSLRLFPPLKPFERRDQLPDIHGIFVYITTSRLICIAPLANEVELQAELDDPRSD